MAVHHKNRAVFLLSLTKEIENPYAQHRYRQAVELRKLYEKGITCAKK